MRSKPTLCYVIPSLEVGGTERQLSYLAQEMAAEFNVHVICTRTAGPFAERVANSAELCVLDLRGGWDPRFRFRVQRLFHKINPDVVHTYLFGFDYAANVAAREAGAPVVLSSRRQLATWKRPRHVRLQRRANSLVDGVVANCKAVAAFCIEQESVDPDQVYVIRNGIDPRRFQSNTPGDEMRERLGLPLDVPVIGMVANFTPVKDHALMVDIVSELAARRRDFHMLLIGDGPLRGRIERKLHTLGLRRRATFLTGRRDVEALYACIDCSLVCSRSEGFPNTVMESMAAEIPVVAAAVGGVPELITHDQSGLLVDSRQPSAFADAIELCLNDTRLREKLRGNARRFVCEHLSIETMAAAHLQLYDRLLSNKRKAA